MLRTVNRKFEFNLSNVILDTRRKSDESRNIIFDVTSISVPFSKVKVLLMSAGTISKGLVQASLKYNAFVRSTCTSSETSSKQAKHY